MFVSFEALPAAYTSRSTIDRSALLLCHQNQLSVVYHHSGSTICV